MSSFTSSLTLPPPTLLNHVSTFSFNGILGTVYFEKCTMAEFSFLRFNFLLVAVQVSCSSGDSEFKDYVCLR